MLVFKGTLCVMLTLSMENKRNEKPCKGNAFSFIFVYTVLFESFLSHAIICASITVSTVVSQTLAGITTIIECVHKIIQHR